MQNRQREKEFANEVTQKLDAFIAEFIASSKNVEKRKALKKHGKNTQSKFTLM